MKECVVQWTIELDAEDPEDAARKALEMIKDPNSIAHVFDVFHPGKGHWARVDLNDIDGRK